MSRRRWPTNRARREIERMRKFRSRSRRLIGKTQDLRGRKTEKACTALFLKMIELKKIKRSMIVCRCSWMDFIWGVDHIVENIHGFFIPIQFKTSYAAAEEFKRKRKDFFEKKFGTFPVILVLPPGESGENQIPDLTEKINNWRGQFKFREGHLRYNEFFDHSKHRDLGHSSGPRVEAFFKWLRSKEKQKRPRP